MFGRTLHVIITFVEINADPKHKIPVVNIKIRTLLERFESVHNILTVKEPEARYSSPTNYLAENNHGKKAFD